MRHELITRCLRTAPAALGLIGLLAACAAPVMRPSTQITNARASIAQAESAGATQRAPVELLAARDKLARAEAAARAEDFLLAERKSRAVKAQSNTLLR